MPGPIKFKLGVCVSHDEYMNPIVFGVIQCRFGSKLSKKGDFVKCCEIVLVNTISPDCLVRSSLNLVCVFPMMSEPYCFGADPRSFWVKTCNLGDFVKFFL